MNRRSIAYLFIVICSQFNLRAQIEFTLPLWMAEIMGKERTERVSFQDENNFHDAWAKETRRPHRFVGAYRMDGYRTMEDTTILIMQLEGWQDTNRSITVVQAIEQELRYTYVADLDADVALIAEQHGTTEQVQVKRISRLVKTASWWQDQYGYSDDRYIEQVPDSVSGQEATLLGVTCGEHRLKNNSGAIFWTDASRHSPFAGMGRWLPLYEDAFAMFGSLSVLDQGFPMKWENGVGMYLATQVTDGPVPMPVVDLSRFEIVIDSLDGHNIEVTGNAEVTETLTGQLGEQVPLDTTEVACDTTILEHHYTCCITANDGRFIAFGNRNEQQERHGWWYEVSKKGRSPKVTEYHNGLRIHERWRRGCLWRIDENGTVISKGKADRRAKSTF